MEIEGLFEKVYELKCENKEWKLPDIELSSEKQHLRDEKVEELKSALNNLKGSLNDFEIGDWHKHTTYCNPAALVNKQIRNYFHPELCTQAWCKFHEILCFDQLLPDFALSSKLVAAVHICEAPGAFICSLNHYLKSHHKNVKYKWLACTLNPYYEGNDADSCVADDRLIFRTLKQWCFGPDNTGDIFSKSLLEDVSKRAATFERVCLVTADGSFNCQKNPAQQEMDTSRLKFTELLYALSILDFGGSFVMKIFTPLEYTSIQLLYILCCTFESVKIRKPATSKPGNSELYVVAKCYNKLDWEHTLLIALRKLCIEGSERARLDLFNTNALPNDFVTRYKSCVDAFVQYQINAINYNIKRYDKKEAVELEDLHQTVATMAIEKMGLKNIPRNQCIIKSGVLKKPISSNIDLRPKMSGTFTDRRLLVRTGDMSSPSQLQGNLTWISSKPAEFKYDMELSFGKPLQTIRTSLFCDTDKLIVLNHSESIQHHINPNIERTKSSTIADCLKEMVSSGNGQVYEAELWVNGKTCSEVLGLAGHECSCYSPLKLSSPVILGKGSLLLASLLKSTYELDVVQEILSVNHCLKLVLYVLQNSRPGANMVLVLPSALTRLTAGLLHIIRNTYSSYAITTVDKFIPCLMIFLRDFTEAGRYALLLETALKHASEMPDDCDLLGIMSVVELLQDERFVKVLRKCNHALVGALQRRRERPAT